MERLLGKKCDLQQLQFEIWGINAHVLIDKVHSALQEKKHNSQLQQAKGIMHTQDKMLRIKEEVLTLLLLQSLITMQ